MILRNGWRAAASACLVLLLIQSGFAQQFGQKIDEINADGTGYEELYLVPQNSAVGSPVISVDGKWLALEFSNLRISNGRLAETGSRHAWLRTFELSKLRKVPAAQRTQPVTSEQPGVVLAGTGNGSMPSWSPKANRLAFTISASGGVYVMTREGSQLSRVHPKGWGATWSPNGRMVAYFSSPNGDALMCYDLVEDEEFIVLRTLSNLIESGFAWSPDSRSITFSAHTRQGTAVIARCYVLKRDTYQELRTGIVARGISWHPDGKRLLFANLARVSYRLTTIPATAEEPDNQSPPEMIPGVPDMISAGDPALSPDGKKILFVGSPTR